jgi:hypothetical protein
MKVWLAILVLALGGQAPPPMPPISKPIRHRDGEYGPEKWTWEAAASVQDPVSRETFFIGGRVGGVETGHIGHWALGADGKSWRELKGASAVLDPLRVKALAARAPAKQAEAAARNVYYGGTEKEPEAVRTLLEKAVKLSGALQAALDGAKGKSWEDEGIARAKVRAAKAVGNLTAAQTGTIDAAMLRRCFDAQWALDEAAACLASSPGPREFPSVAADPESRCVVVFGGLHGDYALADTWVYDKEWRQVWPKTAPSARFRATFGWNAEKKTLLLSGGQAILNKMVYQQGEMDAPKETWEYNARERAWSGEGGVEPGTRVYRTIVPSYDPRWYDAAPRGDRVATEAWLAKLPANVWTVVPEPPASAAERDWGTAIIDPDRDRIYRWTGGHCADPANGMSTYHPAINRWSTPFVPEILAGRKGMSFNGRPDCANHTYLHYTYDLVTRKVVCVATGGTGIFNPDLGDFESTIAHPFNRHIYESCAAGTSRGVVFWGRGYFGLLDVKSGEWSKLPVQGPLPQPKCDGSAFCYDARRDALWMTTFLDYQKPSGNIWRYDLKTGAVAAMNPANAETIGKAKGFNSEIRESVHVPSADLVLYNNLVQGKQVAYDCAKNRWVVTNIKCGLERQGSVSDTLTWDARRGLVWNLSAYKRIYVLRLDPKSLTLSDNPAN